MKEELSGRKRNWWTGKIFKKRSSIYGQVVYVITLLSIFLFVAFGIIFRSVNEQYMQNVIQQTGDNIGFLVEGSLYYSMLENDKTSLQNTLDIIRDMPGIEDVSMYNHEDSLVYSSLPNSNKKDVVFNPDCSSCHNDVSNLFPASSNGHEVLSKGSRCGMNEQTPDHRHLLIRRPIMNEPSCYTNACHIHSPEENVLGALVVNIPLTDLDNALQESSTDFFILATLMTGLLLSFLLFFTRKKIQRPLSSILQASEAVASGDMTKRLDVESNQLDDMKVVSKAFNNMLEKINKVNKELQNWSQQLEYKVQKKTEELNDAQNELIKVERMASLGRLSSSVAHELNNPLAGVITYTKLVQKQLNKPDLLPEKKEQLIKYLLIIESEVKRCGDIVKGLLDFSRKDQQGFEDKPLNDVLKETKRLMINKIKMADISFITNFEADSDVISCVPNQIKQAFLAMLVNATEAVSENGEITLVTSNPDDSHILVQVKDNGVGISGEDIQHIFEPFFSAKDKTSGIGLGLAIVHGIIQNHKGEIEVDSTPGKGTTFSILFPLSS